jgi:6-pyruvoyltetrahydropterin/6-carboxytetrahydropterin synthase
MRLKISLNFLEEQLKNDKVFYLTKTFTFDSAHNLVNYKGKCEKLHGHTYKLDVTVKGTLNDEDMVIDFVDFKNIVKDKVVDILDHSYINDILKQPSTENIALWIWNQLFQVLKADNYELYEVKVWETKSSFVTFRG